MSGPLLYAKGEEGYYFKPSTATNDNSNTPILHISNNNTSLVKSQYFPHTGIQSISLILGIVHLRHGKYVIICDKSEETGRIRGHSIQRVKSFKILSVNHHLPLSTSISDDDDRQYLELLNLHLNNATLFFSYTYDLTNSHQRQAQAQSPGSFIWQQADSRFFWNKYISSDLIDLAASNFITPVIYGYAHIIDTYTNGSNIQFGIITRRSTLRAGTRYFRRGVDKDGNVANFNETEQLLIVPDVAKGAFDTYSFLQTRGSVPVYWAEINNLKYKPQLCIGPTPLDASRAHFDQQLALYGKNYLVNLVDNKGYELPVKRAYESVVEALGYDQNNEIKYIYFDYHHECRKFQWHRVKLLIDQLTGFGLTQDDYYQERRTTGDGQLEVIKLQRSIVRTNCMDCLDRTNVVQSTLAHWVLQSQLQNSSIIPTSTAWENDSRLLYQFQNIWADNADYVSKAYSGTGALKTDYTRTGKRTKLGAWNDLCNSVMRYYKNNLTDGSRQDSFDLFLGGFQANQTLQSPFIDSRPIGVQLIPYALITAGVLMVVTWLYPRGSLLSWKNLLILGSCLSVLGAGGDYLVKNGLQFVNWPKLVVPEFLTKREVIAEKGGKSNGVWFGRNGAYVPTKGGVTKSD
ncbi:hypothetical protein WICPIJ_003492 [Wickerhamomyces pijperi]|uniref:SAC domain-containing protein n=1 Tax=Wickerhamomyces pijperi TaxID=599730 RepID=A0A9P8TNU2_WICPI|nr:hypothetical protein WICPIJ_003492 [Wickerhamomyces pijperi]